MADPRYLQPRKGMTSVEAAALFLSDGQTRDPELAEQIDKGHVLDMDELERSAIARSVGFPFDVTIDYKRHRFICVDKTNGYKTTAYYQDMDEHAIKRLVRALTRLKKAHDESIVQTSNN